MNKYLTALILLCLSAGANIHAQELRGTVRGNDGEPLVGASVYWEGTNIGTSADSKGAFVLHMVKGYNRLIASYMGYCSDTLQVVGKERNMEFRLNADGTTLDEIVVTSTERGNYIRHDALAKEEVISFAGLTKLACCNLAESFENSASVTVGYSDAISGARQIKMLGLAGTYTQILDESRPIMRGMSSPYGLNYTPGMWLSSIQVSKGVSSVAAGHDAITGQINLEYRKPTDRERLFVNLYLDNQLRPELNLTTALPVSRDQKLTTILLLHASADNDLRHNDHNRDGYRDLPKSSQLNVANRWFYSADNGMQVRFGWRFVDESRLGGRTDYTDTPEEREHMATDWNSATETPLYGSHIDIRNANAYVKIAKPIGASVYNAETRTEMRSNVAFVADYEYFDEKAYFGLNDYDGSENTLSINLMYNCYFDSRSSLMSGIQARMSDYGEHMTNRTPWLTADNAVYDLSRRESEIGAYTEYTYTVKDRFTLVAGLRGDYNSFYRKAFLTPRGHLRWNIAPTTVLRGSAGLGYRSTNLLTDNIGVLATGRRIVFDHGESDFDFASFNRLERALTAGGSLTQTFSLGGYDNASLSLDYFRTRFYHSIVADQERNATEIDFYESDSKSFTDTYQADFTWTPVERFDILATVRYSDSRMPIERPDGTTTMVERPLVSRYKALLNVQYATKFRRWVFDFTAQLNGWSRIPSQTGNLADDSHSPSYPLFFAQITHKMGLADLYVGCENIGDFRQQVPIMNADAPYSAGFNSMNVWGPLMCRKIYAGIRFNLY